MGKFVPCVSKINEILTPQMYKVYVNSVPVFLGTPESIGSLGLLPGKDIYTAPYLGKRKQIKQYLDLLDKNTAVKIVAFYAEKAEQLWEDFRNCYKELEAAGGFVTNADGKMLVFYRRGSWDMPKGKIDPGESPEEAALREVREETGLQNLNLGSLITQTWHTYRQNGERILKCTWWYRMTTSDTKLVPQVEEDIEEIHWVDATTWLASKPEVYASIREVIELALHEQKPD